MITFANIRAEQWYLILAGIALLAGIGCSLVWLERRHHARIQGFAGPTLLPRLVRGYAAWLRRPLNPLVFVGVLMLLVALAGPEWGTEPGRPSQGGREIMVLLDTSESMNAVNPAPSRLERARQKIRTLLSRHPADRFGLIAFSGSAGLQCPLTTDHGYFRTVLEAIDTDMISAEGTNIAAALDAAADVFLQDSERDSRAGRDTRIVLLMSDGEAVSGNAARAAADLATSSHVLVMGIGDPEGAEVTRPQWMQRGRSPAADGGTHVSRLDEENLSGIAVAGDGVYVRSTLSDDDVDVIDRELAYLSGSTSADEVAGRDPINRYRWPLFAAFLLFGAEGTWLVAMPLLVRRTPDSHDVEVADDAA